MIWCPEPDSSRTHVTGARDDLVILVTRTIRMKDVIVLLDKQRASKVLLRSCPLGKFSCMCLPGLDKWSLGQIGEAMSSTEMCLEVEILLWLVYE